MLTELVALSLILIALGVLAIFWIRYRKKKPSLRPYPVFQRLSEEVGRVAEEGSTVHIALGQGNLIGDDAMVSITALQGLSALIDLSAAYDTPPLITTSDPVLYLLASDWMRRAYARLGNTKLYRPIFVQYAATTPATYAAMTATNLYDGGIGSNVILGAFDAEISLLAEAAQRRGIRSVGGTTSVPGLSALYPALGVEQLVMGEELFAAGAEVINRPVFWSSLLVQDVLRWLVIVGIAGASLWALLGLGG